MKISIISYMNFFNINILKEYIKYSNNIIYSAGIF